MGIGQVVFSFKVRRKPNAKALLHQQQISSSVFLVANVMGISEHL